MAVPESTTDLLKGKYNLHKAPEVESAAKRHFFRTGERIPQNPSDRIQNYLNRFHEIIDRDDPQQREQGVDAMKRLLYRKYVVKPDEIPESYWETQKRIIRERGQGADLEGTDFEAMKRQNAEAVIADQKASLDRWIDYLSSEDAPYADALKYWTLRSVLSMSEYDKVKKVYPQRSRGTTKPFPDLNREALAYVLDAVEKKYASGKSEKVADEDKDPEFEKLLQGENFGKLYGWAIEKVTPVDTEKLLITKGQWIKYKQGSDHKPLIQSIQGFGTGWCTAGESTAQKQLQAGDFYVYYSQDHDGKAKVPRVAIRMEGNNIAEVRGIAEEQNLDPYVAPVVEKKLEEFPDGKAYQKKSADMKKLTDVERKMKTNVPLESSDLAFLYEIDTTIQGFGYSRDPRIDELKSQRNPQEDLPMTFDCKPEQIAHTASEIRPDTKIYVGPLTPGIFMQIQEGNIEHVYTTFPEGKIKRQIVMTGGKSKRNLLKELERESMIGFSNVSEIINSSEFPIEPDSRLIDTVNLSRQDLNLDRSSTYEQVCQRAQELGLELCPPELGPRYRLQYRDEHEEILLVGMKPILKSSQPYIFYLKSQNYGARGHYKPRLYAGYAGTDTTIQPLPDGKFIFSLPNQKQDTKPRNFFLRLLRRG